MHRRRWLVAVLGLASFLAVITVVRRDSRILESVYGIGNLLETHTGSDIPEGAFQVSVAHLEFLVLAILVTLYGRRPKQQVAATLAAFAVSFAAIYFDSVARYSAKVAGHLYVFVCDDAFISMRYARNFAEGRGLVYNLGEAVDGFTNPLWTGFMVLPHAAKLHEGVATVPVVIAGGGLLFATALLARSLLASFAVPEPLQWLAALAVVYDASSLEFAITGLETPLVGFSITLVAWAHFRKRPGAMATGLVLLTLARADGMAIAVIVLGWLVLEHRAQSGQGLLAATRAFDRWLALVLAVGFGLVGWRYALYEHPFPNTYYLKVYSLGKRLAVGIGSYGVRGLVMYGLPVVYVLLHGGANDRTRTARRLLIAVGGVWLYSMYVGGDVFIFMRFFGPVTPLLWMAVALVAGVEWSTKTRASMATTFGLMALAIPVKSERGVLGATWDHGLWVEQNITAAKTIERNVPADATVATFYAGMPYFAPHHRFVDLLGKTEAHIAHESEVHGMIPGHNKFDFPYIYDVRRPDVTFSAMTCGDIERFVSLSPDARQARVADVQTHPTLYQAPVMQAGDPTFLELYVPNRVVLRDGANTAEDTLGCWYVRTGANVPLAWQIARE